MSVEDWTILDEFVKCTYHPNQPFTLACSSLNCTFKPINCIICLMEDKEHSTKHYSSIMNVNNFVENMQK